MSSRQVTLFLYMIEHVFPTKFASSQDSFWKLESFSIDIVSGGIVGLAPQAVNVQFNGEYGLLILGGAALGILLTKDFDNECTLYIIATCIFGGFVYFLVQYLLTSNAIAAEAKERFDSASREFKAIKQIFEKEVRPFMGSETFFISQNVSKLTSDYTSVDSLLNELIYLFKNKCYPKFSAKCDLFDKSANELKGNINLISPKIQECLRLEAMKQETTENILEKHETVIEMYSDFIKCYERSQIVKLRVVREQLTVCFNSYQDSFMASLEKFRNGTQINEREKHNLLTATMLFRENIKSSQNEATLICEEDSCRQKTAKYFKHEFKNTVKKYRSLERNFGESVDLTVKTVVADTRRKFEEFESMLQESVDNLTEPEPDFDTVKNLFEVGTSDFLHAIESNEAIIQEALRQSGIKKVKLDHLNFEKQRTSEVFNELMDWFNNHGNPEFESFVQALEKEFALFKSGFKKSKRIIEESENDQAIEAIANVFSEKASKFCQNVTHSEDEIKRRLKIQERRRMTKNFLTAQYKMAIAFHKVTEERCGDKLKEAITIHNEMVETYQTFLSDFEGYIKCIDCLDDLSYIERMENEFSSKTEIFRHTILSSEKRLHEYIKDCELKESLIKNLTRHQQRAFNSYTEVTNLVESSMHEKNPEVLTKVEEEYSCYQKVFEALTEKTRRSCGSSIDFWTTESQFAETTKQFVEKMSQALNLLKDQIAKEKQIGQTNQLLLERNESTIKNYQTLVETYKVKDLHDVADILQDLQNKYDDLQAISTKLTEVGHYSTDDVLLLQDRLAEKTKEFERDLSSREEQLKRRVQNYKIRKTTLRRIKSWHEQIVDKHDSLVKLYEELDDEEYPKMLETASAKFVQFETKYEQMRLDISSGIEVSSLEFVESEFVNTAGALQASLEAKRKQIEQILEDNKIEKSKKSNLTDHEKKMKENRIRFNKIKQFIPETVEDGLDLRTMTQELEKLNLDNIWNKFSGRFENLKYEYKVSRDTNRQFECIGHIATLLSEFSKTLDELERRVRMITDRFATNDERLLARSIKAQSMDMSKPDLQNIRIFKVTKTLVYEDRANLFRQYDVGDPKPESTEIHPTKVIIMAGMTGSGKSLMINNMVNYICGTSYDDPFRFKLILEDEEIFDRRDGNASLANSMTRFVTSYRLKFQRGFRVIFSLIIIDTPGLGDTNGCEYDRRTVESLNKLFNYKPEKGNGYAVDELSSLCLVAQASPAKRAAEQLYVFHYITEIFGRDVAENIALLITFADTRRPPVLETLKEVNDAFSKENYFKFNNSALYADNCHEKNTKLDWDFSYESLKQFFMHLNGIQPKSLSLTKEVMAERESLHKLLDSLRGRIDDNFRSLSSIESMTSEIMELKGTLEANRNNKIRKTVRKQEVEIIGHEITNCRVCMFTCHNPCPIKGDDKRNCSAMYEEKCQRCPKNCSWRDHSNGDRVYKYIDVVIEETVEEILKNYNIAVGERGDKLKLLKTLESEYFGKKLSLFEDISSTCTAAKRLEEISLGKSMLTNVGYIKVLIQSEELSRRPNKARRIEQLEHFRKKAQTLNEVRSTQFQELTKYEKKVKQAIENAERDYESDRKGIKQPKK